MKFRERSKEVAEQWKKMSAVEKAPYVNAYNADREKFEWEKKKYLESLVKSGKLEMVKAQVCILVH